MIAAARPILDNYGAPMPPSPRASRELTELRSANRQAASHGHRAINARYDAAGDGDFMRNYWTAADGLDADSANSKGVRTRSVRRSRYEVGNNGYSDGMVQTHANYVVGLGPSLRVTTDNKPFNTEVEERWFEWCEAIQFRRKLWCLAHAKTQDGDTFGIARNNPSILPESRINLDWVLFETEQCTTPHLPYGVQGYIDGIRFDEYGNPLWYDVLKYHPGGSWFVMDRTPEKVPAKFVQHWFMLRRPGQHRGVPEFISSLNAGGSSRRFREATITAAETAANHSAVMKTDQDADAGDTPVVPMSSTQIEKGMLTALPYGWDLNQMKAEHPNASYESFHRANINEQGRPKNMPFGMAACDSASYNFASGKLDRQPYYEGVKCERHDGELLVVEPLFKIWWQRACLAYGWNIKYGADHRRAPKHAWDWPCLPEGDERSVTGANDTALRNGTKTHRQRDAEQGIDFDERVAQMAKDYGVSEQEIRLRLLNAVLPATGSPAGAAPTDNQPAAEFGGLSRLQWQRNVKAIRDVLTGLMDGTYSDLAAQTMLESIGLSSEKCQALIQDSHDGQLDDPALQPAAAGGVNVSA